MTDPIWGLVAAALVALSVAQLLLLRKLEKEFRADHGHSMRDLADRMETLMITAASEAGSVAVDLVADRQAIADVASDLASAHARADAIDGHPGEASDAASRSPKEGGP